MNQALKIEVHKLDHQTKERVSRDMIGRFEREEEEEKEYR